MPEKHSSVNHKDYSIAARMLSRTFEMGFWSCEREPSSRYRRNQFYLDLSKLPKWQTLTLKTYPLLVGRDQWFTWINLFEDKTSRYRGRLDLWSESHWKIVWELFGWMKHLRSSTLLILFPLWDDSPWCWVRGLPWGRALMVAGLCFLKDAETFVGCGSWKKGCMPRLPLIPFFLRWWCGDRSWSSRNCHLVVPEGC